MIGVIGVSGVIGVISVIGRLGTLAAQALAAAHASAHSPQPRAQGSWCNTSGNTALAPAWRSRAAATVMVQPLR